MATHYRQDNLPGEVISPAIFCSIIVPGKKFLLKCFANSFPTWPRPVQIVLFWQFEPAEVGKLIEKHFSYYYTTTRARALSWNPDWLIVELTGMRASKENSSTISSK
jgi:hypothetical protein